MVEYVPPRRENILPPYRIPEVARLFNVSEQLVRQAIRRGELDAFRLGKLWLIRPDSVQRLLNSSPSDEDIASGLEGRS
jgi:excisionase family DNA binding protein